MPSRRCDNLTALLGALAACLAACAGGCRVAPSGEAALAVWAAGDMVNLTEDLAAGNDDLVYDDSSRTLNLFCAANETVSFQLIVDAGPAPREDIRLAWDELAAPDGARLPASAVRAYRMWPVQVNEYPAWYLRTSERRPQPARFYDALIPSDAPKQGMPYSLAAKGRLAMWIDLAVGRQARPGNYSGQMRVSAAGAPDVTIRLKLQVYDFVLPDTRPLLTVGGFDHGMLFGQFLQRDGKPFKPSWLDRNDPLTRQGLVLLRQLMTLAHEHRLDLVDRGIRPLAKRDMYGAMQLSWDDYDAVVKPYLDGTAFEDRIGCPLWPVPLDESEPDASRYGGYDNLQYRQTATTMLQQSLGHFQQMGLADRLVFWPVRQQQADGQYGRFVPLAKLARLVAPSLPILAELPADPPAEMGWRVPQEYRSLFDLLAPPGHLMDPTEQQRLAVPESPLRGLYWAGGLPPAAPSLDVIASPADARAVPWLAIKYNLTGLLLADVLGWQGNPYQAAPHDDVRLFYPGDQAGLEGVVPSVRLKRLRRGLQDVAYVWLLRQRGREAIAQPIVDSLARYAGTAAAGEHALDARLDGWARDGRSWHQAHRLLADEVLAAIRPGEQTQQQVLASRVAWAKFDDEARRVRVEQIRSHCEPANGGVDLRVTIEVDLCNELTRPVDIRLQLGALPAGVSADQGHVDVAALGPGQRQTAGVHVVCRQLPTSGGGKMVIPLELTAGTRRQSLQAEVPLLVCSPIRRAIVVDGDLSDWPMRRGNMAGEFRLVGRRGLEALAKPAHGTTVYIASDEENLFLGFICDWPADQPLVARPDNRVRYDQMLAMGEDLVEVMVDPGAGATATSDLYHLVLKSSGVMITERGVSSQPPLGVAQPWAAAVQAAVRRSDKFWAAELAIPLSALGDKSAQAFWGIDFARHTTGVQESSSWSGASRYFYHPRGLGMLFRLPAE